MHLARVVLFEKNSTSHVQKRASAENWLGNSLACKLVSQFKLALLSLVGSECCELTSSSLENTGPALGKVLWEKSEGAAAKHIETNTTAIVLLAAVGGREMNPWNIICLGVIHQTSRWILF